MNKCGGMGVVLSEQAQGEGGDWVVAPRTVQLHKQLTALLECVDQSHFEGLECMYSTGTVYYSTGAVLYNI